MSKFVKALEQAGRDNLSMLRAPVSVAAPYELLRSSKLESLLAEAPPFVPFSDCRLTSEAIDPDEVTGFVFNAHPILPAPYNDCASTPATPSRPGRRRGEVA